MFEIVFIAILFTSMFVLLIIDKVKTGLVLGATLLILLASGIINATEALRGFSNPAMVTVALLFVVSEGVRNSNLLHVLSDTKVKKGSYFSVLIKTLFPVSILSAFLNNTPIVLIYAPTLRKISHKLGFKSSKLLMPLSFAAIIGGTCTLIGSSTNLVVHGLLLHDGRAGLGFFELALIGIPLLIITFLYMAICGKQKLPDYPDIIDSIDSSSRDYFLECSLEDNSPLIGKSVAEARLRNLDQLYLMSIERINTSIETVEEKTILRQGDRLLFVGNTHSISQLSQFPGIKPIAEQSFTKDFKSLSSHFVEVVLSDNFRGKEKTVKEIDFRKRYGAVIVGVNRNGERIPEKIGSIELKAGDMLLLLTNEGFYTSYNDSKEFYYVSSPKKHKHTEYDGRKRLIAVAVLAVMVLGAALAHYLPFPGAERFDMLLFAGLAAGSFMLLGFIDHRKYSSFINWDIIITIGCAFGLSIGLQKSGVADMIASNLIAFLQWGGPFAVLIGVYLLTNFFTELITNNAAAALMYPIAVSTADILGVSGKPFIIAIIIAASASFATPIGYQTNLFVKNIAGYRFKDFLRFGLPLNFIIMAAAVFLIPLIWSF